MVIAEATIKGQIVIPVELRKKYKIQKGSKLAIIDREGEIILKPLHEDPIEYACGFLNKYPGPSALKELIKDRKREAKL